MQQTSGRELTRYVCPSGKGLFYHQMPPHEPEKEADDKTVKSCFPECQPAFSDTTFGIQAPLPTSPLFSTISNKLINNPSPSLSPSHQGNQQVQEAHN